MLYKEYSERLLIKFFLQKKILIAVVRQYSFYLEIYLAQCVEILIDGLQKQIKRLIKKT